MDSRGTSKAEELDKNDASISWNSYM